MRAFVPLLAVLLLAGCTAADDAKQALADAQERLAQAEQEAADARTRFERFRSMDIVREELLQLNLTIRVTNGTLTFEPDASRAGTPIPRENLTRLPDVRLETSGVHAQCEPLTCSVRVPSGFALTAAWADRPDEKVPVSHGAVLSREDARALVTTAARDLTD